MAITFNFTQKELEYDGLGKAIRIRLNLEATDGTYTGVSHRVLIFEKPYKQVVDWTQEEIDAEADKHKDVCMEQEAIEDLNYKMENAQ
jgi:hypothetical protein